MADDDVETGSNQDPYSVLAATLGGPEKAALMLMQQRQAGVNAQQQKLMDMMQQQEGPLSQTGMSDYQKAAMMFQAAGALAAPTRSRGLAGLMEGIGGAGTALAGPLTKADEQQRQRQQQLAQLQLARQKLATEMAGSGVSAQDMMSLIKSQRESEEEPSEFDKILKELSPEERAKAVRVKAGLETAAGKEKKDKVSDKTLSDFSESGATLADIDNLSSRFKPDYAGKLFELTGEAQNIAGRKGLSPGFQDQASWWSDYAERRNVARNTLFGSAVTATEKAEFEKADISPGMDPKVIQQKLARQREIARSAAYKLAKAKELQGFDIEPIEAALGYKIKDLEKSAAPPKTGGTKSGPTLEEIEAELAKRNK